MGWSARKGGFKWRTAFMKKNSASLDVGTGVQKLKYGERTSRGSWLVIGMVVCAADKARKQKGKTRDKIEVYGSIYIVVDNVTYSASPLKAWVEPRRNYLQ
jgi:hypothetical protein